MKKSISVFSALLLFILFVFVSSAHPGRTDANGWHFDRSTGIYHYHHGYPAHQHPNGVCPYDYDDKTDHSGRSASGSVNRSASLTVPETTQTYKTPSKTKDTEASLPFTAVLLIVLAVVLLSIFIIRKRKTAKAPPVAPPKPVAAVPPVPAFKLDELPLKKLSSLSIPKAVPKETPEDKIKRYKMELLRYYLCDPKTKALSTDLPKEDFAVNYLIAKRLLSEKDLFANVPNLPDDIRFGENREILIKSKSAELPFGSYTLFRSRNGSKYHFKKGCSGAVIPVNMLEMRPQKHEYCMNCRSEHGYSLPDLSWLKDYEFLLSVGSVYFSDPDLQSLYDGCNL